MDVKYFDNCATTRTDDEVAAVLDKYQREKYFNPSSPNGFSVDVRRDVEVSRAKIARILGADADEIYFTSGGTEADNIAVSGAVRARKGNVVLTAAEHSAVFNTVRKLTERGTVVRIAKNLRNGAIDKKDFLSKIDEDTCLAVMMHVNNETGAINDIDSLCDEVKNINQKTLVFSDGIQAVGKIPVNVKRSGVDLYTFSGHKIHGGKGIGCLYVKKGTSVSPLVFGGGQEAGLRSGTEYVGGAVALSLALEKAVALIRENTEKYLSFGKILREALENTADKIILSELGECCPAVFSVVFADIRAEVAVHMLENFGIVVGTGSACSSKFKTSRVIAACDFDNRYLEGLVRISFSKYTTTEEVRLLAEKLPYAVAEIRKLTADKKR